MSKRVSLREFGRIHALFFGRRHLPIRDRPDRRLGGARLPGAAPHHHDDGDDESGKSRSVVGHRVFQAREERDRPAGTKDDTNLREGDQDPPSGIGPRQIRGRDPAYGQRQICLRALPFPVPM